MRSLSGIIIILALAGCATTDYAPPVTDTRAEPYSGRLYSAPDTSGLGGLFIWPVSGRLLLPYGGWKGKSGNKGIDIKADEGQSVRASRAGKVVFCDPNFKGFGKTVIMDHGDNFQTVYSYNQGIMVSVGDVVEQGGVIAKVGRSGRAGEPSLHFEIRKNGEPQNPVYYLTRQLQ